ncbi:MAG TPA: MarR family transcriptional regulator [Dehalococcoidia bacterium]|nr:MarR family transcriptional regulator [Dehalococcoidia bacterium]
MDINHVLDLTDRFFRMAYSRVPTSWLAADITMTQFKVLLTIYVDGPQSCGALASTLDLSLPTMTGILNRLNRRGYLKRERDPRDGRRVISGLSKKGREVMERLWVAGREQLAYILQGVPVEDLRALERALEIFTRAVESVPPPRPAEEGSHA